LPELRATDAETVEAVAKTCLTHWSAILMKID
jgi:hypothetical protein